MENVLLLKQSLRFPNERPVIIIPGVRWVLTKIFGNKEVLAYVTSTEKEHGTKRLFFSTIFRKICRFSVHGEKAPLNQTEVTGMKYIPLLHIFVSLEY